MGADPTGPVDVAALETIRAMATGHELVERVTLVEDAGRRMGLTITLDGDRYPGEVMVALIRVTWFENDDYSIHYREEWEDGSTWQCRWDSHPHGHDVARAHFHEPPDASGDPITDHVDDVSAYSLVTRTMAVVRERIDALWKSR